MNNNIDKQPGQFGNDQTGTQGKKPLSEGVDNQKQTQGQDRYSQSGTSTSH